ncbi:MAG: hypothetical protein Q7U23_09270 [Methylococcales bacterium]|nr:hypothetical protein [Methylococcales bacterium]
MKWFVIIILAIAWLSEPKIALVGSILFVIYYLLKKPVQYDDDTNQPKPARQSSAITASDIADLVLLRLELQNLREAGAIDSERYAELNQQIDALCIRHLAEFNSIADNTLWQERRTLAWERLNHYADTPLGKPPWKLETDDSMTASPAEDWQSSTTPDNASPFAVDTAPAVTLTKDTIDYEPVQTAQHNVATDAHQPAVFAIDEADHSSTLLQVSKSPAQQTRKPEPTLNQYAWQPHEPTRIERALSALSGWHSMAVPFLMQNIGWFIGVFCFIAGSTFLVHSTEGYASNLIAFFAFFIFTLALLFGGYQLRSKRPELETSSTVLFILSLLLIPLTTLTATQLLMSSDSGGLRILSSLLILVELGVFYFVVTLVSGLMDRSLQQGLPRFFIALTAMCTLQPVLTGIPAWQLLAVIHLLIMTILSAGIYTYATQWLQAIFIDHRKISYFAAGTLVYAALVSFVFISTGNNIALPDGYYGFFLMLLSGLLFFVDAQFKQWTQQAAYLSRFSFFVYGLSVLALCLVAGYQTASILTLILAIGLYAFIVWRYLTLTPLSIFLACCFWLYDLLVLQHLPEATHLLASLPVLLALHRAAHWALTKRQSAYLALIVFRVLYSLLAVLTVWSLSYSDAGLLAMTTALTAGVLTYYALKSAPQAIFTPYSKIADKVELNSYQNLLTTPWFYTLPALGILIVSYAPPLAVLGEAQFSLGVLLLSAAWAYSGLSTFFNANSATNKPIAQRLNSALLSLLVALSPLWNMSNLPRIVVLLLAGAIALWLSYKLLSRGLFYLLFALWGAAFALLKLTYFPPPSNGMVTVILGIVIWCWLWHVERQELSDSRQLEREVASQKRALLPSLTVLGIYPLSSSTVLFKDLIATPMAQLMVLAWLLTMKAIIMRWLLEMPSYGWLAAILLAGVLGGLLIIRYLLIQLMPIPIALVLGALLLLLTFIGLPTTSLLLVAVLFGLTVWQLTRYSLKQPVFIKLMEILNPDLPDESERIARVTHNTAFFIVLSAVSIQLLGIDSVRNLPTLLTLVSTAGFFWLSDQSYPQKLVRYWVLGFALLATSELISLTLHPFTWQTINNDVYAGLLFALLSLPLATLATRINDYAKPAAITAIGLVLGSVCMQIPQVTNSLTGIGALDYSVLFLAGFSLLLANVRFKWTSCNIGAFVIWILAILWLESRVLYPHHSFSLWLGEASSAHSWLVLGLLSLIMSLLSHKLVDRQQWTAIYCSPLNTVANLCFGLTLLSTLTLFLATRGQAAILLWLLLVLLPTTFSLSINWFNAAQLRGLASACLPTLILFNFLLSSSLSPLLAQTITVAGGYALWLCASFVLPRFNNSSPKWAIAPRFFPWLGFILVVLSSYWWKLPSVTILGIYYLELSAYCVLMLRYSRWFGFSWLAAGALTAAGIAFNFDNEHLPINLLLWSNAQLLLANACYRKAEAIALRWQWRQAVSGFAFEWMVRLVLLVYLLALSIYLGVDFIDANTLRYGGFANTLPVSVLLAVSFAHLLWLRFSKTAVHGLIWAVLLSLWAIYIASFSTLFQPPLLLAIWSVLLFAIGYACSRLHHPHQRDINIAITRWLYLSVGLATVSLCAYSASDLPELLLSLAIITCLSAALGERSPRSFWQLIASLEGLAFLHLYPFLWVDTQNVLALLPWYALQLIVLACVCMRLLANTDYARYAGWLTALSLVELSGHGLLVKIWVMTNAPLHFLYAPLDAIAALTTGLIICAIGVRHVRHLPNSSWLYGIVTLLYALAFYSRLLLLGNDPTSLWDTTLLIVFAYSLFFSQRLFPSKPLLNMALLMPVLALFTVPLQLASPETSATLIISGVLYALMHRHSEQKIPLYMALLAFNGGVYLWIPSLVDSSQLLQIYVIPAALSVLLLLHLHSRELKPSVLMASRLAAISSIYACATVDVFLRAELGIFILAMALSIGGILLGIALRTRAFLYAGVSFLVLNVLGQLMRFYPEQGLGKAIVLMVMGAIIISLMIWFNIKRTAILQRINALQAEMQTWE